VAADAAKTGANAIQVPISILDHLIMIVLLFNALPFSPPSHLLAPNGQISELPGPHTNIFVFSLIN
jgi:hypothetical protein